MMAFPVKRSGVGSKTFGHGAQLQTRRPNLAVNTDARVRGFAPALAPVTLVRWASRTVHRHVGSQIHRAVKSQNAREETDNENV